MMKIKSIFFFFLMIAGLSISCRAYEIVPFSSVAPEFWYSDYELEYIEIEKKNLGKALSVIEKSVALYEPGLIDSCLDFICLTGFLSFFGQEYGGTYLIDESTGKNGLILSYQYTDQTGKILENRLHHEFSSLIYRSFEEEFPEEKWLALNPRNFLYEGTPYSSFYQTGTGNLLEHKRKLWKSGFFNRYATVSMENDFNVTAAETMMMTEEMENELRSYPRLYKKVLLVRKYYGKISEKTCQKIIDDEGEEYK